MRVFVSHTVPDPIIHNAVWSLEDLSTAITASREALMPAFEVLEQIEEAAPSGSFDKIRAQRANGQLHIIEERLAGHSDMAYAIYQKAAADEERKFAEMGMQDVDAPVLGAIYTLDGGRSPSERLAELAGYLETSPGSRFTVGRADDIAADIRAVLKSPSEQDVTDAARAVGNGEWPLCADDAARYKPLWDFAMPSKSTIKRHTDRLRWREAVEDCEREILISATMPTADDELVSQQGDRTAAAYHRMLAIRAPSPAEAARKLLIMRKWECGSPSDAAWNSILDDMEALIGAA